MQGFIDDISIHAPRTGSDAYRSKTISVQPQFQSTLPARGATAAHCRVSWWTLFQSTLPARGATCAGNVVRPQSRISIHAPRTGSDHIEDAFTLVAPPISIHAPRTGSDPLHPNQSVARRISIHAPRTGSDCNPSDKVHTM